MEGGETLTSDLFCYLEDIEIYILCIICPSSARMVTCKALYPRVFQVMLLYLLFIHHEMGDGLLGAIFMDFVVVFV